MQTFQDAFISYGREDSKSFAAQLNRRLVDHGLTVWFDFDDIPLGVDYQKQINDGIDKADNFLFILSPRSVNSPYCRLEIELALKRNKRIIPLLHVEQISRATWQQRHPNGTDEAWDVYQAEGQHSIFPNIHPAISKINWIYFREGVDDFEASFQGLLAIFDRHKDYVNQHTRLLAKALEWEQNQKRSPFLLIGEERLRAEEWLKVRFKESQPPCLPTELHCEFVTESRKNADNLMTEVFLAYAEENWAAAEQIRNSLRREGFTVWTNTTDIHAGAEFQTVIDRGIEEADNVVYLLSPASVRSPHCQHELAYALSFNKRIIPVLVEAIAPEQIPPGVQGLQYIDLTDNVQESDYQADESQLLQVLRQNAAYHETHKLLLTKALKWERQHHNPTLLLRGYNLQQAEAWLKLAKQMPAYPALPLQDTLIAESLRQPPGVSLDVFISYSRADSGFARRLNDALQIQGKRTWFDQESIAAGTADFQQEIHRGIESADTFLFVLSPRSLNSPYCADEVEYAASLNKRFVTLLHQPIDPSTLHPELAKVQWLDFNQRGGDFSANFTELLRILDTDSDHLHAHTRLLLRAIAWDEKGRKESLLLREDELTDAEQWLAQSAGKEPQPTELQQSYIANSRSVEDANQQASQILKAAAAKGKRLVMVGAIAGSIGLLVAGVAGWFAWQAETKIKVADVRLQTAASSEQSLSGNKFGALLTALQSGQALQNQFRADSAEWKDLQPRIMAALQQAITGIHEKNTLQGHQDVVASVSFSPDGKTIASGSFDNTIKLWDAATGELLNTLEGQHNAVNSISFSPDGKTIASGRGDNTIELWDVATGKLLNTLEGHQNIVRSISFSPDGKTLASGSDGTTIKLWDVATGKLLNTLEGHQDRVWGISFSPDGKTLASGSHDQTIKLWDVATGKLLNTLEGHQALVFSISFSPDSKTLASGSGDNTIKLWDVATGKLLNTLEGHQAQVMSIRFSPDGKTIASGSYDQTIKLWDVATGKLLNTLEGHQAPVFSISFSPDGKTLTSGSSDKTIKLWSVTDTPLHTLSGHQNAVYAVSFSSDGKTLASGSDDQTIKLWDVATGKLLNTLEGHQALVASISFSPDGKTLASGSYDQMIKLWDVATGKLLNTLEGHQLPVLGISFSPDGRTIASGSIDQTVKLWDAATGKLLNTLEGHQDRVTSISFSPDGKTIASGSFDYTIKLWDVATGKLLNTLEGRQSEVASVSFSPDGKTIASGSFDYTIKLWNVETGKLLNTLEGHQSPVLSISFNPDGKTIASGSYDNTVKLLEVATGKLLHTLEGHKGTTWSVSFSPDGKTIASASADGTIKLWVWDFDRLMTMGCDWIKVYLITHESDRPLCDGYLSNSPD
ncbi:MAG: TIR domain-containing protein [Oculatellaceae cyanobacterium bins.114]|nr:TIR domain-containing protein [Oculatellaceae cyanobacterium bins.114]